MPNVPGFTQNSPVDHGIDYAQAGLSELISELRKTNLIPVLVEFSLTQHVPDELFSIPDVKLRQAMLDYLEAPFGLLESASALKPESGWTSRRVYRVVFDPSVGGIRGDKRYDEFDSHTQTKVMRKLSVLGNEHALVLFREGWRATTGVTLPNPPETTVFEADSISDSNPLPAFSLGSPLLAKIPDFLAYRGLPIWDGEPQWPRPFHESSGAWTNHWFDLGWSAGASFFPAQKEKEFELRRGIEIDQTVRLEWSYHFDRDRDQNLYVKKFEYKVSTPFKDGAVELTETLDVDRFIPNPEIPAKMFETAEDPMLSVFMPLPRPLNASRSTFLWFAAGANVLVIGAVGWIVLKRRRRKAQNANE